MSGLLGTAGQVAYFIGDYGESTALFGFTVSFLGGVGGQQGVLRHLLHGGRHFVHGRDNLIGFMLFLLHPRWSCR
jgi:hypothetical protein